MRSYPLISITNHSTVIDDAKVKDIVTALQHQITYHFKPYWDSGAVLRFTGKVPLTNSWELAFLDDSDQAGALGYHDFNPTGLPTGRVFAKTDQKYSLSPSVTASHEILEMLADPYISLASQTSDTEFYAYEVGDPVEADELGYIINIGTPMTPNQILVSDFILPHWFIPGSPKKYDYMGHLTAPLQVASGGYVSIFTSGKGWASYQRKSGIMQEVPLEADNPRFRNRSLAAPAPRTAPSSPDAA